MRKVLELKGYKSYRAFQAFQTLMLGLKMLPAYMTESYETFYSRLNEMPPEDQEKMIREASFFVELSKDDIESLICFCTDKNGVPYTAENVKNLGPQEFIDVIVAVCVKISEIKVNLVTESEKKKFLTSQLI